MYFDLHPLAILQGLILLAIANGSPVFAKKLLGDRCVWPIDGGLLLWDGQPFLGRSKTVRGLVIAVLLTTLTAPLLCIDPLTGALTGTGAMVGDLLSSFTKRRLKLPPSSMAPGLDQVPESLLPLLICAPRLGLSALDAVIAVAIFWVGELGLSRWLYAMKIRDRPY